MTEIQEDNISVAVRIRPLNDRERKFNATPILTIDTNNPQKLWIDAKPEPKPFIFDNLIDSSVGQAEIFELVGKPQAQFCLKGYNASIFAYGQTGAGKTFTMLGKTGEARGLQPRVFEYIFDELSKFESSRVKCSYLEIYNEQIIDLLSVSGTTLLVREDTKKGVYIEGLSEERVTNAEQAIELLNTGARNRHVSSTQMNFESSRSHSLFSLTIETKDREESGEIEKIKCSKFHFVDLAGSERQNLTCAAGQTLKEASNINKSLTVLGCVINSLVEQSSGKTRHIPYRDSKLTFILKDSLGGNSKTCIISAVSDASISFQETLSTLKFAQRAKMIKNKAKLNEENMITDVRILRLEIKQLREKVDQMREHEALLERTVREARAAMTHDTRSTMDNSEELEILRQQIELVNAECERNELEFASGIQILNQQYRSEISKFESAFSEMNTELQTQFKHDLQKQLTITPAQNKYKVANVTAFDEEGSGKSILQENQTEKLLRAINQEIIHTPANRMNGTSGEDQMELEGQPHVTPFVSESFYLKSLNHLLTKINDSVQSRQQLQQSLLKLGSNNENHGFEKTRFGDESIQNLRKEYANQLQSLQQQLHESRESRQQLARDLHKAQSALSSAQSELVAKESEMKSMESMYMEICSTMHEETEQKSTKRIVELEEKVIVLTEEASLLKREHTRISEFLMQSEQERSSLESDYQQLKDTLEARESRRAILESEMNVMSERIKELESREQNSQQRILSLSNELETFIASSAEMLEEANRFERIELTNETLTASNEALTAFNEKLNSEISKLNDQIEVLTTSNTFLQTRIEDLMSSTGVHEKIRFENMELNKKCARIQEQYDSLQADLQNLRVNSTENSEALVDQNKALYRRIDEYVTEIDSLVKESNILKQQSARKQEQITKLQQKNNDIQQSQKHFQAAHKDVQDKLTQAQLRISTMKEKSKALKESDKSVTDLEGNLKAREDEITHLQALLEERSNRCNEVCMKLNELLDDKERAAHIQIEKEAQIKVQEAQNRLIETTAAMQKEKINLLQKMQKVEQEKEELGLKHKGLEDTFNNLIVQYSLMKGEHNQMMIMTKQMNGGVMPMFAKQGISKLETEVQQKSEKITDLQCYLDKYALQMKHLEAENTKAIRDLDTSKKNMLTQQAIIAESEKRIDDLVEVIGEFEMQCGAASNLLENLTQEHEENVNQMSSMRESAMAAAAAVAQTRQTTTTTMTTTSGPSVQIINPKDYELLRLRDQKLTRKLKKYKMKLILMARSTKHHKGHDSSEALLLRSQLHEKEKASKRYQEMGDELSGKLIQANKKIAQQMEHIQFQLKCYEEDKKHTRIEAERTIKSLQTQLDEKQKLLAAKQLRMTYFENLHGQITESLDKNHQVYSQNLEVIKEKERRISYAQKLQCEIHNQLSAVVNRKAFFKSSDESLRLALVRILDFIEHRSLDSVTDHQPHNKENQDINRSSHAVSRREPPPLPAPNSLATAGMLKPLEMQMNNSLNHEKSGKHHSSHTYSHLNINSKMIAKDIEDLDRKLEKEYKKNGGDFVLSPILEQEMITPVCTLFNDIPKPHKSHKSKRHKTTSSSNGLFPPDLKTGSSKLTSLQQFQTAKKYSPDQDHTKTLHRYLDESIANIFAETNASQAALRRSTEEGDMLRKKLKN